MANGQTVTILALAMVALGGCHRHAVVDAKQASAGTVAAQIADSGVHFTAGAWETQVQAADLAIEGMNGAISAQIKGGQDGVRMHSDRTCLTPEQASHPERQFLTKGNDNCTYKQFTMGDGKLSGTMQCGDRGDTTTMVMTGTYTADSYAMKLALNGHDDGSKLNMHLSISAHRVGDCRPGDN
jgi:hypothetical protein